MDESTLPVVTSPVEIMAHAGDAAGACKAIVSQTAMTIQGKKYVKVEGWQAIAIAHGCVASARDVEELPSGWKAVGEIRRMDTGAVIATAEGFVGRDEKMWAARPEYASRAMAQTRAISRACRSAFAHVVVMMNAGLETTPAEEMSHDAATVQPIRQPERKQPTQAALPLPVEGSLVATGTLKKVYTKDGTTKDKAWRRTSIIVETEAGDSPWLSTFDTDLGVQASDLEGAQVRATYQPGRKEGNYDLLELSEAGSNWETEAEVGAAG